jgi:hypothetical protein
MSFPQIQDRKTSKKGMCHLAELPSLKLVNIRRQSGDATGCTGRKRAHSPEAAKRPGRTAEESSPRDSDADGDKPLYQHEHTTESVDAERDL